MSNGRPILALSLLILSLLAIQPALAQDCGECPPLPTISGVRWTSYNSIVWNRPADLSNINGYTVVSRFSTGAFWGSRFVQPNTSTSHTFVGLPTTIRWAQVYVYATPADPNANRRSLVAPFSSACFGPCPEPIHSRINWFPPAMAGGMMSMIDQRLNPHTAAPVVMYRNPAGEGLVLWAVVSASEGLPLFAVPGIAALAEAGHPGGELARVSHPDSDKPIVVTWLPESEQLEVSTFYADVPPYQMDKPYVYRIDRDDQVTIIAW